MSRLKDTRYKALDHHIRQEIVTLLAKMPQTYSQLLVKLDIESGHLAYHIRNLDELLEKDEQGNYQLNTKGIQAHDFLIGRTKKTIDNKNERILLNLVFISIFFIMAIIIFTPTDKIAEQRYNEQKVDTHVLLNQSLDVVYEIFEDWEIPREQWTNLLLNIINIRSNLENLYYYSEDIQFKKYIEQLDYYEIELSNVIVIGDPDYMKLTIEKRHLIRELHSLFLQIGESL